MKSRGFAALTSALVVAGAFVAPPVQAAPVPATTCSVFPSNNIWNADISSLPVHAQSAAWLNSTGANSGTKLHPDFGGPPYGIPFNVVDNSHATTNFTFQYAGESDPGPYPYGNDLLIENGSDAHLLSINRNTCKLYETFATNYAGPSTAGSGAIFDLASNALRPAGWTSADAAGLPIFPGLVRLDEVQAGVIGHAIRFTVQQSDQSYLWPARHQAGSAANPNLPPMGARFRLKSSFDITTFGAASQVVLTAMKRYGLIVADNGSNWFFTGTMDAGWNSGPYPQMISELKAVPANMFEAVDESSLMGDPNSGMTGVPGTPTGVTATAGDMSASVSWTAPVSSGSSPITSYVVTAYDGCTIQGSMTVSGAPPATSVSFAGLTNGTAYTFKVSAVNSTGTGPQSAASNVVTPNGATPPTWMAACSTRQYTLTGNNGSTWADLDATNLAVNFTPSTSSWALITANVDLWTANAGYNQDVGVALNGSVVAWKESGGFAGTFSPNAATVQTAVPVAAGTPYNVKLQWKTNLSDPGTIYAGAGPLGAAYSPARLTVQLIPNIAGRVFTASSTAQYQLGGSDGSTWKDLDAANLSVTFLPPAGTWMAYVFANSDLWTSLAGYNQDLGIAVNGSLLAWKESGGFAGTFSPNAAFVQATIAGPLSGSYSAKLQWKANRADPAAIWAGAGPIGNKYSPTTLTVVLAAPSTALASSTTQYSQASSDGATWKTMDSTALQWTLAPGIDVNYKVSAGADLWTSAAGYNQDIGVMVSGGAYGAGTLVAWKESGGFAGTYSPNAAFVTADLHLQGGNTYKAWVVWKANRSAPSSVIWSGAGPISSGFSPTSLTALLLG